LEKKGRFLYFSPNCPIRIQTHRLWRNLLKSEGPSSIGRRASLLMYVFTPNNLRRMIGSWNEATLILL
jgi:hypothetical protein